jgi:hypothetical protein
MDGSMDGSGSTVVCLLVGKETSFDEGNDSVGVDGDLVALEAFRVGGRGLIGRSEGSNFGSEERGREWGRRVRGEAREAREGSAQAGQDTLPASFPQRSIEESCCTY